jgi:hypothetical protein
MLCGVHIVFGYFADVCDNLAREMVRVVTLLKGVWEDPALAARFTSLLQFAHKLFMTLDRAAVGEFDLLSALGHVSISLQLDPISRGFCVDLVKHLARSRERELSARGNDVRAAAYATVILNPNTRSAQAFVLTEEGRRWLDSDAGMRCAANKQPRHDHPKGLWTIARHVAFVDDSSIEIAELDRRHDS